MRSASRLILLLLAMPVFFASGCVPMVAWLPDSSGFVFLEGPARSLIHYDMKSKKRTVLAEKLDTCSVLPGLHPDGKQIVLAHIVESGGVQLSFRGLDGKPIKTSRVFEKFFGEEEAMNPLFRSVGLLWSPDGKKILFRKFAQEFVYDVGRDEIKSIKVEIAPIALKFNVSPFLPDSKGLIGASDPTHLALVDWAGAVTEIKGLPDRQMCVQAHWEKGQLFWQQRDCCYVIDPITATATRTKQKLDVLELDNKKTWPLSFADNKTRLWFYRGINSTPDGTDTRVEFHASGKEPVRLLGFENPTSNVYADNMSPDRTMAVIQYVENQQAFLLVVNIKGEIVCRTKLR